MGPPQTDDSGLHERELLVTRFNERVDAAQQAQPSSKERVRAAVRRQGAARCPTRLRRLSHDVILRHGDALADLFVEYPDDTAFIQAYDFSVGYQAPDARISINAVQVLTTPSVWTDEWGTKWEHAEGGVGASPIDNPIKDWAQLDEYISHQLPEPDPTRRLMGARAAVRLHGPTSYVAGQTHLTLFERYHSLRGMENAFEDFYLYPKEADRLLSVLTDWYVEVIRAWGNLENVDAMWMGDDWGSQTALMISPEMWRRFFAARYRRFCDEVHRLGRDVHFHSDGNVIDIIGDLIDAGVDVIDPVQPEAIDMVRVAREFGGKVAFSGGLSDQRLATCSPQEVKDEVHRAIEVLGAPYGNAYILAPSNSLTPEIPLDNLAALFQACHDQ
jgi:uroporphyrinogen decarboxylase